MERFYPAAELVLAPRDGGTYTSGPLKGVLHTTESYSYYPSRESYYGHQNWPHLTAEVENGRFRIYQHIPFDRSARALVNEDGGVQTNRDSAIQIEIAWKAANAPAMPLELLIGLREFMRWAEVNLGIPLTTDRIFEPYPDSYGANGVRFTGPQWDSYSGWCGHQHVPENSHGDPGAIDIGFLLAPRPSATQKAKEHMTFIIDPGNGGLYLVNLEGGVTVVQFPTGTDFVNFANAHPEVKHFKCSTSFLANLQAA